MPGTSVRSPSWNLIRPATSSVQRPAAFRSRTRYGLRIVKSPDRFDFAKRFLYIGSMHGEVPTMFAIVAVGAIASTLEFRIPCRAIFSRTGAQSSLPPRGTGISRPRSCSRRSTVSWGSRPRSHLEPA